MPHNIDRGDEPRSEEIAGLSREIPPPEGLEEQVIGALREEGLIGAGAGSRRGWFIRSVAVAAGLILMTAVGFAGGRWSAPEARGDYILLLRAGPNEAQVTGREEEMRQVREYSAWAQEAAQRGNLVAGEKLTDEDPVLLAGSTSRGPAFRDRLVDSNIEGYFLIRASDEKEARRIASGCPHLRYGGAIEVRKIERFEEDRS